MTIHEEILAWSENQPRWQKDALRRIYVAGSLTKADLDELYEIAAEREGGPQGTPATAAHVGAGASAGVVRLLELAKLEGVNGFPSGRGLKFAPDGLTVVFGENGVGKSGYARVLKRACRARRSAQVLGNAFVAADAKKPAKGEVHYSVDGAATHHPWVDGQPVHDHLASVAVFDSECAQDYVEAEGAPSFQPFGIRALNELVRACVELDRRAQADLAACRTETAAFQSLVGETAVGRFVKSLSAKSDPTLIRKLGTLTEVEQKRLAELTAVLSQSDPEPGAQRLDRLAARLAAVATRLDEANRFVTPAAVERLAERIGAAARGAASRDEARKLIAGDHLPGTGEASWRTMMDAARTFSETQAYPGKPFPLVDEHARCVLCQGILTAESRESLSNYGAFITSPAARDAAASQDALDKARTALQQASAELQVDDVMRAELNEAGSDLVARVDAWSAAWAARRAGMVNARSPADCAALPAMPADAATSADVLRFADVLKKRSKDLRDTADPEKRRALQAEHAELVARTACAPHVSAIEHCIEAMRKAEAISKVRSRCASLAASRRVTDLGEKYITEALLKGLQEELTALGYSRGDKHQIPTRTQKGVMLCKVALNGAVVPAGDVLSEGELRATALAFFLAELRLTDKPSTLVFDDPVTSLDHRFRAHIARRLADLALTRQVIVFTHDAVFLTSLQRAAEKAGCAIAGRRIEWNEGPGSAEVGLGWENMTTKERLGALREEHARIKKSWSAYPNEQNKKDMANAYDHLRGTMERIVRDDLLNNVMAPFSDEIRLEAFAAVYGMDHAQWEAFVDVYDRACEAFRGHDTPGEAQTPLPTPEQLEKDIALLGEVREAAKKRKEAAEAKQNQRRKSRRAGAEAIRA